MISAFVVLVSKSLPLESPRMRIGSLPSFSQRTARSQARTHSLFTWVGVGVGVGEEGGIPAEKKVERKEREGGALAYGRGACVCLTDGANFLGFGQFLIPAISPHRPNPSPISRLRFHGFPRPRVTKRRWPISPSPSISSGSSLPFQFEPDFDSGPSAISWSDSITPTAKEGRKDPRMGSAALLDSAAATGNAPAASADDDSSSSKSSPGEFGEPRFCSWWWGVFAHFACSI